MARGKQQQEKKDGQHRKESKEERRARLEAEREAKEQCLKILPYVGLVLIVFLIGFGFYVRSVPKKEPKIQQDLNIPLTGAGDNQNMKVSIHEDGTDSPPRVTLDEERVEGETLEL